MGVNPYRAYLQPVQMCLSFVCVTSTTTRAAGGGGRDAHLVVGTRKTIGSWWINIVPMCSSSSFLTPITPSVLVKATLKLFVVSEHAATV